MSSPQFDLTTYFETYFSVLQRIDRPAVEHMAQAVFEAWRGGKNVFLCGNGGNAANAVHIAADLVKLTAPPRGRRLRAIALGETFAGLTAIANDIAYEQVYAEQLRAFLSPGDLVIGLSTSGSSPNVLRALEYANEAGGITMGITGLGGLKLQGCTQFPIVIASTSVQQIEDATMLIGHLVCLMVRDQVLAYAEREAEAPAVGGPLPLASAADRIRPVARQARATDSRTRGDSVRATV